jgi:ABC-2 type transport system permease protein
MRRILAISKKNIQALFHDRRTLGLLIFMPILIMLLFGYLFGQNVKNVPIKIVNLDQGGPGVDWQPFPHGPITHINDTQYSDVGINFLNQDDRVTVTMLNSTDFNETTEKSKIWGGNDYYALIIFPVNFSEDMANFSKEINIIIDLDGSDPQITPSIFGAIADMINNVTNSMSNGTAHFNLIKDYVAGNADLKPIDYMAPGILSFTILLFMILNVTGGFTKERTTGTIFRIRTTPTTKADILLGYLIGNSLVAMVQCALLLVIGTLIFNITITGSLLLLFAILFVYALSCVAVGILASAIAETELQAFQMIPLTVVPSMFISGFIIPINSFPVIFQWISKIIPMTFSIKISRAIMLNGFGLDMFLPDFLYLIALTVIFMVIALLVFRTKK